LAPVYWKSHQCHGLKFGGKVTLSGYPQPFIGKNDRNTLVGFAVPYFLLGVNLTCVQQRPAVMQVKHKNSDSAAPCNPATGLVFFITSQNESSKNNVKSDC
jgi:hypothetical protein